jgi:hypothetical protein
MWHSRLIFLSFKIISAVVPDAIWFVNKQPTLERTIFGLYRSLLGLAIITASDELHLLFVIIAPMFPGFSGASATSQWIV